MSVATHLRDEASRHPLLAVLAGFALISVAALMLPLAIEAFPGAGAAYFLARRARPDLPSRHFLRSRGAWLLALGGVASLGVLRAAAAAYAHDMPRALFLLAVAALATWLVHQVMKGKMMKSILELVPVGQRGQLDHFLAGARPSATVGQVADLSGIDPVTAEASIRGRVIGQDAAVRESVQLVFRRARLRRPHKPVATLMFVGATGAGKTELAKGIADELFAGRLVRVDCNEMSQPQSTQRLIGAPPGYVGSDQGGWLCRELMRTGTGVLLLDEIEKAHPDVLTLLMGLLDEARLTEQSSGQTYSASGFVIVLTSNSGHEAIAKIVAQHAAGPERAGLIKSELQAGGMKPEVLARLDAVVPFGPLDRAAVVEIVGRFLLQFARDAGIELVSVDAALLIDLVQRREKLAGFGVREVVRLVESAVVDGFLDVRDAGFAKAAIELAGDEVVVCGVGMEG